MAWLGRTFRAKNPDIPDALPHLIIAITDAEDDEDEIVLVSMISFLRGDAPCILEPADADCKCISKFLTHRSTIAYKDTMVCKLKVLKAAIRKGSFKNGPAAGDALICRIQDGAIESSEFLQQKAIPFVEQAIEERDTDYATSDA